jgi:hypothetical protein
MIVSKNERLMRPLNSFAPTTKTLSLFVLLTHLINGV